MKNFNLNTENCETWLTPPELVGLLGHFDLDPCCPPGMPWRTADRMLTPADDGLSSDWGGGSRVWLNPPYGRETFRWLDKLSRHKGGGLALIFARTETRGFHEVVWDRADALYFFKGRLAFHRVDGSRGNAANAPSVLVSYTREDSFRIQAAFLRQAGFPGKLIRIKL